MVNLHVGREQMPPCLCLVQHVVIYNKYNHIKTCNTKEEIVINNGDRTEWGPIQSVRLYISNNQNWMTA